MDTLKYQVIKKFEVWNMNFINQFVIFQKDMEPDTYIQSVFIIGFYLFHSCNFPLKLFLKIYFGQ